MNRRVRNAVIIKFKNIFFSPAIKVTLVLAVILSIILSFFPFFKDSFFSSDDLIIASSVNLGEFDNPKIIVKDENTEKYDIRVYFSKEIYHVEVTTKLGFENVGIITDKIKELNLENLSSGNDLSELDQTRLLNLNIVISQSNDSIHQIDEKTMNFLMFLMMLFYLVMMLLISRIGAQVAYEKGNKVTEVILTSITRRQLFFSHVISAIFVVIISVVAVSAPMIAAYIIDDPSIVSDFSFFSGSKILFFLFHLIAVSICLVICVIGTSSMVKQAEDANVFSIFALLPLCISFTYFIYSHDIFRGAWTALNYIPFVSAFPVFGGILSDFITQRNILVICLSDIAFLLLEYIVFRNVYCKKISNS